MLTIGLSTFNNAPHNRLWQDMASMVENMSSYFTAFADARGLQGSPPFVLPASFTPLLGFLPGAHSAWDNCLSTPQFGVL